MTSCRVLAITDTRCWLPSWKWEGQLVTTAPAPAGGMHRLGGWEEPRDGPAHVLTCLYPAPACPHTLGGLWHHSFRIKTCGGLKLSAEPTLLINPWEMPHLSSLLSRAQNLNSSRHWKGWPCWRIWGFSQPFAQLPAALLAKNQSTKPWTPRGSLHLPRCIFFWKLPVK